MNSFERGSMAVVGVGGIFPKARNVYELWANVVAGNSAIRPLPIDRWNRVFLGSDNDKKGIYTDRGAFLDEGVGVDATKFGIMPIAAENMEPDQLIALAVADMALTDARQRCTIPDPDRIGVILGKGGYIAPGQIRSANELRESQQLARSIAQIFPSVSHSGVARLARLYAEQVGGIDSDMAVGMISNMAASRIANRFDLRGPAYLVDGACASSLVALDHAMSELALGRVDMVLVGGVHHCHDVTLWRLFSQLGALSKSGEVRPFSASADGTLLGEGTGMVVVKRLEDALQDGDDVYAAVTGIGISSDGRDASVVSPSWSAQERAIRRAWKEAGIDMGSAGAVGYIEGHGTATPLGDEAELTALRKVLGDDRSLGTVYLGSVKALVGHTMAAAGIVGLIKAIMAVSEAVIPMMPSDGDATDALQDSRMEISRTSFPWKENSVVRRAGLNAFGFGGVNAHVVLEEVERAMDSKLGSRVLEVQQVSRVPVRLAARTVSDLDDLLSQPVSVLEGLSPLDFDENWPARACLSTVDSKVLGLARSALKGSSSIVQAAEFAVCREPLLGPGNGRLAMVFPGLEIQRRNIDLDDIVEASHCKMPTAGLEGVVGQARLALWLARVLASSYRDAGFDGLDVMGVSIGELAAAVETNRLREEDVSEAMSACDPVALGIQEMPYAAISASRERVKDLLNGHNVWITHDNSPTQTLVCGNVIDLRKFLNELRQHGIVGNILDVASGFHTPLLEPAVEYIAELVRHHGRSGSENFLWSATTGGRIGQDDESTHLARLLSAEVHLRSLIEVMWDDGVRGFIQFGEGTVPAMIDETLRGRPHIAMSALVPNRSALAQLRWIVGCMWAAGYRMESKFRDERSVLRTTLGVIRDHSAETVSQALKLGSPLIDLDDDCVKSMREIVIAEGRSQTTDLDATSRAVADVITDDSEKKLLEQPVVRSERLRIDLDTMPFARDHEFFRQAPGWPRSEDSSPVLPATTTLALMERAVVELAGVGRHINVVESLTLSKWIQCAPGFDVDLKVRKHKNRYHVAFGEFASGVFLTSDSWQVPGKMDKRRDLGHVWRPSMTAKQRYERRRLFHGPSFQTLVGFDRCWPSGARGTLKWNGVPGSLLDAVGQLLGCWVQECYRTNLRIMPVRVDRIEYFGPPPGIGVPVNCVVTVRDISDRFVEADMNLEVAQQTWCRITGWRSRRFIDDRNIQWSSWWPERTPLAMAHPGGWWSYSLEGEDLPTRQFILNNQLGFRERAIYEEERPAARRGWMLSRIAAKDAVRAEMWNTQRLRCFPAEISVMRDQIGRPVALRTLDGEPIPVHVSLAHCGCVGVAVASTKQCGIDVEQVRQRGQDGWRFALSSAEIEVLREFDARHVCGWEFTATAAWCAKEAASKMLGEGLKGDPRRFVVLSADWNAERNRGVLDISRSKLSIRVLCTSETWGINADTYVVAWTKHSVR